MAEKMNQKFTTRPPIVVILGHIDHGKTTLLDQIRKSHVAERETGGITQHVGAYEVEFKGKKITFIDTPGHEAFSAMRARGAKVADIAILVVAADDGVQTQTKEAISYIKKAQIPLIVAINKIDKPTANPERVKRELSEENVLVESLGGKIPAVEVSAKTGKRIEDLLELILLVAEMENLQADISKSGQGVVIESYLDNQRGPTATLLLRDGILKLGDIVATASTFGKIKILENFQGKPIKEAFPSMPVVCLGFEKVPQVGERFEVFSEIEKAKEYLEKMKSEKKSREEMFIAEPGKRILNLIIKTDVLGSIEAIEEVLKTLPQDKVALRILKAEAGSINESDIKLAKTAKAKILGFRVKTDPIAQRLAEREKIKIGTFEVIYDLAQTVREWMQKILAPEIVRTDLGKLKTLVVFWSEKNRQIVGGKVLEGEIKKNGTLIEVFREDEKIGEGRLINLQINKRDVERVTKGQECGILYEGNVKIQEGDILVFFTKERKKLQL
jgi:translation initiation factor IF-2